MLSSDLGACLSMGSFKGILEDLEGIFGGPEGILDWPWAGLGGILGDVRAFGGLGGILVDFKRILEGSWAMLVDFGMVLGDLGGVLEGPWGNLGGCWGDLGGSLGILRWSWGVLGGVLGGFARILGGSWEVLGGLACRWEVSRGALVGAR